jgi:hypothetical protein
MSKARKELLGDLLKATTRSFYLIPHCGTLLPSACARKSASLFPACFPAESV